MAVSAVA